MKKNIRITTITKEVSKSYLEYSMNVIISRALPDVRDGLKPVHRRILFSMYELKKKFNKDYKKSARIVGDVIGKYHPHGDSSVYETIVRMAQKFLSRYNLIDGQGNFGSIDGDSAAAMRYTEIRLSKIGYELLKDIEKNTVKFIDNYDNTEKQPYILPSKIPNILINGSYGIAVGMHTNIPPHNINEIINGCIYILKAKKYSFKNLLNIIKAPDFPTYGLIGNLNDIKCFYKTGQGKIKLKSKIHVEELNCGKSLNIVITELPYLLNKNNFIEKILNLISNKKLLEILNLKDESNKEFIRVVLFLKNKINVSKFLNKLNFMKVFDSTFNANMIVLVNKKPKLLNLKKILNYFIKHRKNIIIKKSIYEIKKFKKIFLKLEGCNIALENINSFINIIKSSKDNFNLIKKIKKIKWDFTNLIKVLLNFRKKIKKKTINILKIFNLKSFFIKKKIYRLSNFQIKNILSIKINRLTIKEKNIFLKKYKNCVKKIIKISKLLSSKKKIKKTVIKELLDIRKKFKDKRKTKIF